VEQRTPPTDARHIQRIGLIGGTFDPIHYGHLVVAEEVRAMLKLAEMIFIPSGSPPHKHGHTNTAPQHRLAMLELAIASNPYFTLSRIEFDRPGPSYLADTLRMLREQWGSAIELSFILGWDSLQEFHHWRDPQGILAQLTHLVAVNRPRYIETIEYNKELETQLPGITQRLLVVDAPQLDISSTDLRRRIAEGRPIKYQVPEAVELYIMRHELYQVGNHKRKV
jgi:nicotinate-nucleotide adenylyltransferase